MKLRQSFAVFCGVLLAALLSSTSAIAYLSAPADVTPNTDCNAVVKTFTTTEAVTGVGTSAGFGHDSDLWFARNEAKRNLKKNLGRASGVVCKICPDGIQCTRNASYTGETTETVEEWIGPFGDVGVKVTLTYNGEYKVSCSVCPEATE